MARLKTVGFEQNTVLPDSELFFSFGNPKVITNQPVAEGQDPLWNDPFYEWNSETTPWGRIPIYDPDNVRSGKYALRLWAKPEEEFIYLRASTKGGGGYFRLYGKLPYLPNGTSTFAAFVSEGDDTAQVLLKMDNTGRIQVQYRNAGVYTNIGSPSNPLNVGQYYAIEFAVIGNEAGNTRLIEARVDHIRFMQAQVTTLPSHDGYFMVGPNFGGENTATDFKIFVDDLASNDGRTLEHDDQNTWCGPGRVVLLPVIADDGTIEQEGWTRGGSDTGSDWGQVADATPPDDGDTYLIADSLSGSIDFRVENPYNAGIRADDTIKVVAADIRWALSAPALDSSAFLYLRAGSNLPRDGETVPMFGVDWHSSSGQGRAPNPYSCTFLPQSTRRWSIDDLAAARIGMEAVDASPLIHITSLWVIVEYQPYESETDYQILIGGEDRTDEVRNQTVKIEDVLNDQANIASFQMYNLNDEGVPERGETIEISVNGLKKFGGLLTKVDFSQLSNSRDIYTIRCIDWTRILDRRMVSATYENMTDKEIIEAIVDQYCGGEGITTYHVAEGVTISRISFNYVSVSRALQQISKITGRNWYIDYDKDIHYFPLTQAQAPFAITSTGNQHKNFRLVKDDNQLRNRVFVRGGVELTTDPISEAIVADGDQRQFLIAEKPHDFEMTVGGSPVTVGIKNIDDAALFDYLLSFQEKYVEAGTGTVTPIAGTEIVFTYNYDIPVLVAVEDTNSIQDEAEKSGGSGVYEFAIIDKQISSTQQARDRAIAELTDYARGIVQSSYSTMEKGLRTGQYQRVTMANKDVDEDYVVTKVTFQSLGGGLFTHSIELSSAKTLGIIRFLIEMLEINRSVGEFDPNEKVDQFFSLVDQLDSFTDSLTTDSQGLGFPWASDTALPSGKHLRWDLGQWS